MTISLKIPISKNRFQKCYETDEQSGTTREGMALLDNIRHYSKKHVISIPYSLQSMPANAEKFITFP